MGGDGLVEAFVLVLRAEGRQVGRHAQRHRGQRSHRLQTLHQSALPGKLDEPLQKRVAQRLADVAGDAERAAVVQERLGRVGLATLLRGCPIGKQLAKIGHKLPLGFAELVQLPRDEEPRRQPLDAPARGRIRRWFEEPLEELADERRFAATRCTGCPVFAEEAVLIIAVGNVVEGVAHQHAAAAGAVRFVLAAAEEAQELADVGGRRRLRERAGRVGPAMVVAAGRERLRPGTRPVRLNALAVGHLGDHLGREVLQDRPQQISRAPVARAVDQLEPRKEQQQPLELVDRQPPVDAKEHVGHGTDDVFAHQVFLEAINVRPQFLDHAELLFVDARDEHVDLGAVFGEVGRDFVGDERARQMGDLQRALDTVVVGDGDEVHARLPGVAVDVERFDERFRRADAAEKPFAGPVRVFAMDVKIAL